MGCREDRGWCMWWGVPAHLPAREEVPTGTPRLRLGKGDESN